MSARDKLLNNPILFFAVCAVVGYFLLPYIKAALGTPDFLAEDRTSEPQRHYREYPAPGDIGWDGHQRFWGGR